MLSKKFVAACEEIVGKTYLLKEPQERFVYECDACLLVKAPPQLVALPASTEEVAKLVALCQAYQVPFIPRGGGTGLSGGAVAIEGGLMIGLNRMNRILAVNPKERIATVQPGVVNAWLNEALRPYGLFFAPDPSSQAASTIGGNVAENAGGIHCVKYGVTTQHVLSLEVVLPSGKTVWLGNATRHLHGLNLLGVAVGSEGTLGLVTAAKVKLTTLPPESRVYLAAFQTMAEAMAVVEEIIAQGLKPAALECMDAFTVSAVNAAFGVGFPEESGAVILTELDGAKDHLMELSRQVQQIFRRNNALQVREACEEADKKRLWAARKGAVAAYGRMMPAFYLHDCVIPRSKLVEVMGKIEAIAKQYKVMIGNVFHAGDGNLHPNILFDPDDVEMVKQVLVAGEAILEVCLAVGGTLSGEHGIGLEKSQYMERLFTGEDLQKMTDVKQVFDPKGLANPAKIFPTPNACSGSHVQQIDNPLFASGNAWI